MMSFFDWFTRLEASTLTAVREAGLVVRAEALRQRVCAASAIAGIREAVMGVGRGKQG